MALAFSIRPMVFRSRLALFGELPLRGENARSLSPFVLSPHLSSRPRASLASSLYTAEVYLALMF